MDNSNNKQQLNRAEYSGLPSDISGVAPLQATESPTPLPPQKKLSKKALWAIIGGSIAAIIAIVGIVLAVLLLGGPSKQDYQKLYEQVKEIDDAAKQPLKLTKQEAKEISRIIEERNSRVRDALGRADQSRALRDNEVRTVYQEYKTLHETYAETRQHVAQATSAFVAFRQKCGIDGAKPLAITDDAAYDECKRSLEALRSVKPPELTEFASRYLRYLENFREGVRQSIDGDPGGFSKLSASRSPLSPSVSTLPIVGQMLKEKEQTEEKSKALVNLLERRIGKDGR